MEFVPTELPDVTLIKPRVIGDERGFFLESWHKRKFIEGGIDVEFVQDNHSRSVRGTLRGMHYQLEHAQGKLVRVTHGSVYDVAVDLRRGSTTFGRWAGRYLDAEHMHMLWIPAGFAHGFYVVSETADVQYKCTDYYAPNAERCLRWDDADVGIEWPLLDGEPPLLSAKDAAGQRLRDADVY